MPPIVSFHFGSLGFLSPFDFKNYQPKIAQVLGGESFAEYLAHLAAAAYMYVSQLPAACGAQLSAAYVAQL